MSDPTYGLTKHLPDTDYEAAVQHVTGALQAEGFGVLTEIDVKATMKKKLDVDFRRYVILGACNPPLAHRALTAELYIGLLLPCNVIVMEEDDGSSTVSLVNPSEMFKVVENADMAELAAEVDTKLRRVLEGI